MLLEEARKLSFSPLFIKQKQHQTCPRRENKKKMNKGTKQKKEIGWMIERGKDFIVVLKFHYTRMKAYITGAISV